MPSGAAGVDSARMPSHATGYSRMSRPDIGGNRRPAGAVEAVRSHQKSASSVRSPAVVRYRTAGSVRRGDRGDLGVEMQRTTRPMRAAIRS